MNTSKPVGPSKIPAWAIKDAKAALAEPLCYLINQFITEGKFPEDLKRACVTPLFKNRYGLDKFEEGSSTRYYFRTSIISHLRQRFSKDC